LGGPGTTFLTASHTCFSRRDREPSRVIGHWRTGANGVFDFFDAPGRAPAFPRAPADIEPTGRSEDGFLIENFEVFSPDAANKCHNIDFCQDTRMHKLSVFGHQGPLLAAFRPEKG